MPSPAAWAGPRIRRSVERISRLSEQNDAASRGALQAATDVLRYFDLAAPHHHEDEERHVFPPLSNHPDHRVRQAVTTLQDEHVRMHALWQRLRAVLVAWRDTEPAPEITPADRTLVAEFAALYAGHISLEETVVYPAAQVVLDANALDPMGREMAARVTKQGNVEIERVKSLSRGFSISR